MPEFFSTPDDPGEIQQSEMHASLGERLGAQAMDTLDPKNSLSGLYLARRVREGIAGGNVPHDWDGVGTPEQQMALQDNDRAARAKIPDVEIAPQGTAEIMDLGAAQRRVKEEGLEKHLKLPDQPSIKAPVLDLMIQEAHERRDREAAIARGPQGFFPDALGMVTSIGVGMIDPVNIAAFSIPVIGEARWGKILANAGDSIVNRAALNFGKGAAQGALGTAVLQPADWWLHTNDGQDYTAADALRSIAMGAGMGGAMHAAFGAIGDTSARFRRAPLPGSPEDIAMKALALPMPTHPATALADLPPAAREDALRAAIADQIEGRPVRVAEMLDAAAKADPRIAESLALHHVEEPVDDRTNPGAAETTATAGAEPAEAGTVPASGSRPGEAGTAAERVEAREAVFDDIHHKLIASGMGEDEAGYNAALISARYATRAERLGGQAGSALDLYRAEGIDVRSGEITDAEGRAFQQRRGEGPDLFAQREAEGQTSLPGTERIGQGELAQRKADEALKPKVAQKPMDEGLFGDSAAQKSFFQSQPTAPAFYSALGRAVDLTKQEKASPEQWLGMLKNAASVKPEEMKWLGLEDWLKEQSGSVTKAQLQDFIRANQIEVKEVAKESPDEAYPVAGGAGTKYSGYRLPGGENYREMLLTLPAKPETGLEGPAGWLEVGNSRSRSGDQNYRSSHWEEPNILAHIRFDDRISDGKKTLHVAEVQSDWHQAGKRKGYVDPTMEARREELTRQREELAQSGALVDGPLVGNPVRDAANERYEELTREIMALYQKPGGVPDAPFKTTWPELAMKRMIRYAAEHGYERVSWDTGATNAERYDLSKHIDQVMYHADTQRLVALDKNHGTAIDRSVPPEKVADYIGKEAADKLLNSKQMEGVPIHKLENADLKIGGEGMHGFYDKILPATVNKLVKKFGAKVAEGEIGSSREVQTPHFEGSEPTKAQLAQVAEAVEARPTDQRFISPVTGDRQMFQINRASNQQALREVRQQMNSGMSFADAMERHGSHDLAEIFGGKLETRISEENERNTTHAVDITPELRKAAIEQGFPLFQGGGEAPRGRITLADNKAVIDLFKGADKSTFLHETGHLWLDELMRDAEQQHSSEQLRADRDAVLSWLGVKDAGEIGTAQHEKWAEGFERYLADGSAPSNALAKAFEQFKQWLLDVYHAVAGLKQDVSPEIRGVMDRLIATDKEIATRRADLADEAAAVTRNIGPKTPRGRAAADPRTWSLFEYLASKGGLKPDPELHAIFGGKRGPMVGGFGPLLRRDGMALDEAVRSAKDGHYMFDAADVTGAEARLTPRDLLDLLDQENRKQKVYRNDYVAPDRGINDEEEAKHIVGALRDELEASTGQKGIEVDPALEDRVVEIIQKEGGTDVLAAYERPIMEDAARYEGLADERQNHPETAALPGWDRPDAGAASQPGAANPAERGQTGLPAAGEGGANGAQPRSAGNGNRAPLRRALTPAEKAAAFRDLADATPEYNEPAVIEESRWADTLPEPASVDPAKAPAAAQAAVKEAEQIWRDLEPTLSERERLAFNDVLDQMDRDSIAAAQIVKDGAACLAAAVI